MQGPVISLGNPIVEDLLVSGVERFHTYRVCRLVLIVRFAHFELLISALPIRIAQAAQSILPAHCACPHSQASSGPVFSVSQCGLQYRLSFPTKQLQQVCAHRFFLLSSIGKSFQFGRWEIVLVTYRFVCVKRMIVASAKTSKEVGDEQDQ